MNASLPSTTTLSTRSPRASCLVASIALAALAAPLVACSGSGAVDIGGGPTEPVDATIRKEASSGGGDMDVATTSDDTGSGSSSGSSGSGSGGETGIDAGDDASAESDASDAAPTLCSKLCGGCCNSLGQCVTGNKTGVCGASGAMCLDCSSVKTCPLTEAACCTSKGACGCAVAGLVGCN
jgi:hypothetical protein